MPDTKQLYQLQFSNKQDLEEYLIATNMRYRDMGCSTHLLLLPMDERDIELATLAFNATAELYAEPLAPQP